MKTLLAGALVFAACLWSQTTTVQTALAALQNPNIDRSVAVKQLSEAMMPLADANRQPSPKVVEDFAHELAFALAGGKLSNEQIANLDACISLAMKGTVSNLRSTGMLRKALSLAGISDFEMTAIVSRFLAIGEEVRGPDDFRLSRMK